VRRIQQLNRAGLEPTLGQDLLGSSGGHLGEHGAAAGKPNVRRASQMEDVEHAEKETEHIGAADDPDAGFWLAQVGERFIE
jgi:hypothetical protein